MNQTAILRILFPSVKIKLYQALYKHLPETCISEKIVKLRKTHNLDKPTFCKVLNIHIDTLNSWELQNVFPSPNNVKKICELFNIQLSYFHDYYNIYFDKPGSKIKAWKENKGLTYKEACGMLNISHSAFGRLLSGKISLSYDMYLKLKK